MVGLKVLDAQCSDAQAAILQAVPVQEFGTPAPVCVQCDASCVQCDASAPMRMSGFKVSYSSAFMRLLDMRATHLSQLPTEPGTRSDVAWYTHSR